jgi:hypothetical protein
MKDAEAAGWSSSSGLGGVTFTNRSRGEKFTVSRVRDAQDQLGL